MNFIKRMILGAGFGVDISKNILSMREELEEHLRSINENTDEIQTNHSFLAELAEKIEKLSARLEKIECILSSPAGPHKVSPLTGPEKEIFLILYTAEGPITYEALSQHSGMPCTIVKEHVSSLIEKGVPLIKTYVEGHPFLKIDRSFKERQAKENLVNCSLRAFVD